MAVSRLASAIRFRFADVEPSPDAFAAVMATGILSVAAEDHHYRWLSVSLAWVGILTFLVISAMIFVKTAVLKRFPYDLRDPDVVVRLFTFVAACAVLGARLKAHPAETWTFAVLAWPAWVLLAPVAVRSLWRDRWTGLRDRAHGVWELTSVATSGLAIVTAHLVLLTRSRLLLALAIAMLLLAIATYCLSTWLILWRAAAAPDDDIWRPDCWILMGGLAIATLAGERAYRAALSVMSRDWLLHELRSTTVVTWVIATLWVPVLAYMTVRNFRLRFSGAWWAMVFPLGMYSAATFAMLTETKWHPFRTVSLAFFWVALVAWSAVALAAAVELIRRAQTR